MTWEFLKRTLRSEGGFIHKKIFGVARRVVGGVVRTTAGVLLGGGIPTPVSVVQGIARGVLGQRPTRGQQVGTSPVSRLDPIPSGAEVGRTRTETVFVGPRGQAAGQLPTQQRGTQVAVNGTCPPGAVCPKGFRVTKTSYHLRDGTFVPRESRCVRIRRKDFLNGRAALGATRRLTGYVRANRKVARAIRTAARATRHN